MRVYIWCDGAAMPNGGPAGAGYVVVGGVRLLGSEALGDATNNVAEYMAVRNALRAAADAGATSAHVREARAGRHFWSLSESEALRSQR
jgi:ribonuclease HI